MPYSTGLGCDDPLREPPCWVKVTLSYDFNVFVAAEPEFGDTIYWAAEHS